MGRRKGRLAKLLSLPVLVVCGFAVAAAMAGVGLATEVSSTTDTTTDTPPPTVPPTTTVPTPTTTTTTTTTTTPPAFQGCTPGYWKNHTEDWPPTGFSPSQTLESVFDVPDGLGLDTNTLLDALNFGGGPGVPGGSRILLRAAVAALLNSAHPNLNFPLTTGEVIAQVNAALASNNRDTMLSLATMLDNANNAEAGCPGPDVL